uniref:Uncharacterized protein n=1 Tax=Moniliophthora roreri TaxID=221103 RepID=A0A0W0FPI2_MONRR
MSLFGPGDWS